MATDEKEGPDFQRMVDGATNALETVLRMKGGNNVLVVSDESKKDIGKAFEVSAKKIGATVQYYTLPQVNRPLSDIPSDLKDRISGQTAYNVAINAFEGMPEETPFRIKLMTMEMRSGARVGHAPGITKDMMIEGPMNADYSKIAVHANALMDAMKGAKTAHITAPGGTDVTLQIEGRGFETDVLIKEGTIGNLPAGEIWCAPLEDRGDGIIVCDGSIGDMKYLIKEPVIITMKSGKITSIECDDKRMLERIIELTSVDEWASVVGELGIGLNPAAKLTGNLLEDEKAGHTAHIAFGNNYDMMNGQNKSKTHRDFLFRDPTITITYTDGSERVLLKDGNVQL